MRRYVTYKNDVFVFLVGTVVCVCVWGGGGGGGGRGGRGGGGEWGGGRGIGVGCIIFLKKSFLVIIKNEIIYLVMCGLCWQRFSH